MRRQPTRNVLILVVALLLMAVARPVGTVRAAAPALTLGTETIACDAPDLAIDIAGSGFAPGATIVLTAAFANGSGDPDRATIGRANVGVDGTFVDRAQLLGAISCPTISQGPYSQSRSFAIEAFETDATGNPGGATLASAGLAVTAQQRMCFGTIVESAAGGPFCIAGRFLSYWQKHGGLMRFGVPLSSEGRERLDDGNEYVVQYFERARLELHPENAPPYDVLLGQIGRHFHPADPPATPLPDARYFPETGHNLYTGFRDYWEARGGFAAFGLPLSEEFTERLEDGNDYTVQYFERARFEWHPENPAPYRVLLGQLGRRLQSPLIPGPQGGNAAPARMATAPAQP